MSKVMGIYVKFWNFFTMPALQIWLCHVTQETIFEKIIFFPNSAFNIGKSCKFVVEKLSTSEVISQKPHGGWKTVLLGLSQFRPRQRPILSQNKAICGKDDCSST